MEFVINHPDEGLATILVLFDGVPYEADSEHLWWAEIIELAFEDDPRVLDLFPIRPVQRPSEELDPALLIQDEEPIEMPRWQPRNVEEN